MLDLSRFRSWFLTHPLRAPLTALATASALGALLVFAWWLRHRPPFELWPARHFFKPLYLIWNLFLAWVPLGFALRLPELDRCEWRRDWRGWANAAGWLVFFPNAPYIFTDLCHLPGRHHEHFWVELGLILWFSLTGLLVGFLSLFIVHSLTARRFGVVAGWLLVGVVAGLGALGIYIGRFLRWNSWDVLFNPFDLLASLGRLARHRGDAPGSLKFLALFSLFLLASYVMLYSMTMLGGLARQQSVDRMDPSGCPGAGRERPPDAR
jgi:uncharacterized membrane protein